MKYIASLLFLIGQFSSAQKGSPAHHFEYYKNGVFESVEKLQFYVVKDADTIKCGIVDDKIVFPDLSSNATVLVKDGKRNFTIEGVDFQKIDPHSEVIFGVEKKLKNLALVSEDLNAYVLQHRAAIVTIENLNMAKEVCFLVFYSPVSDENKHRTMKSYSRSVVTKSK